MDSHDGTIRRAELADRLRHFNMATYLGTSDLLSGGVVALAAGVALEIVAEPHFDPLRILLWISSALIFTAFHALWRLGSLFAGWSSGMMDYLAPLGLGLFEFAQFIVLSRQVSAETVGLSWLGGVTGQVLMAALFVHNRLRHLKVAGQYSDDAVSFIAAYAEFMRQGRLGAGLWGVGAAVVLAAGTLARADWRPIVIVVAALTSVFLAVASLNASIRFQRRFQALLFGAGEPGGATSA